MEGDGGPVISHTNYTSMSPEILCYFYSFMKKKKKKKKHSHLELSDCYFILKNSQCTLHFPKNSCPLLFPGNITTFQNPNGRAVEIKIKCHHSTCLKTTTQSQQSTATFLKTSAKGATLNKSLKHGSKEGVARDF